MPVLIVGAKATPIPSLIDDPTVAALQTPIDHQAAGKKPPRITAADILLAAPGERITLTVLARQEGVAPSTAWRWATRGVRGIKLPSVMRGSKRITTRAAFEEWCKQLTAAAEGLPAQEALVAVERNDAEERAKRAEMEFARLGLEG